jgi:hypothetical protein
MLRIAAPAHVGRTLEGHVRHLHARGALLQVLDLGTGMHREIARVVDYVPEEVEALRAAELRGALDRHSNERRCVDEADDVVVRRRVGDRGEPDLTARARPMRDDDPRAAGE